ncbi:MAG: DUF192 domain-containing protein [Treponema sp.]|jgi:uncharacterized membrane protein (UPF0127 family)|nr:DUF192 domain-containing protein [Treponema sp.]
MSFKTAVLFCFFIIPAFAGCTSKKLSVEEIPIERDGGELATVKAEIARTHDERNKGLMHRKKINDGEGMLFVFDKDQVLSFWMKNTSIPLSIAFIASDGRIVEIKDLQPHDENPVKSNRSVRYALEVPQGWFNRAGVRPGDTLKL